MKQRFIRISGFPQDQLVMGWAAESVGESAFAGVDDVVTEGGPATIGVLSARCGEHRLLAGAVVEVR